MSKRRRRNYAKEFKKEVIKLVTEKEYSLTEAGRNSGINANMLDHWKREIESVASGIPVDMPEQFIC